MKKENNDPITQEPCKDFISEEKSLLIAPAGYGKTHFIAKALNCTKGKQLILTHTNAGVASIKKKIEELGISSTMYHIETIDSYAQKYVNAFYCGKDIPEQGTNTYFPFIIEQAINLVKIKPINDIIGYTYSGLFVDEYQDCSKVQHQFIMELSRVLPTHLLGDPLQGIFNFRNNDLVRFDIDLIDFKKFEFLKEPFRWKNTKPELGNALKEIRKKLKSNEEINLSEYKDVLEVKIIKEKNLFKPGTDYNKQIWELLQEDEGLLIIHPESSSINPRIKFIKQFNNISYLIESIDSKDFYKFAEKFDSATITNIYTTIYEFLINMLNSEIKNWFNESKLKNKRKEKDKIILKPIRENIEKLQKEVSFLLIADTLKKIVNLPGIKCYRIELFNEIIAALKRAEYKNMSVYKSMVEIRNERRRYGRKFEDKHKYIGTTLLVKGLEFKTVIILNTHRFKDPKNLYVALTRASQRLVIFTESNILNPYK